MSAPVVEPLAWDSEFFDVPIGRVDLDGVEPDRLREIDARAREQGIVCLYGSLDPTRDPEAAVRAQQAGHRLVEVAVTLVRDVEPPLEYPRDVVTVRRGTADDLPALGPMLDRLAPWSRFATDPRFGAGAARRMFDAWVERAARDRSDEWMLLVAEDDTGIVGLSTHVRSPEPRVDLMGVTRPGQGVSWALMQEGMDWAGSERFLAGPIAARNVVVSRFLSRCGFHVHEVRYLFHRWLDDGGAR